LHAAGDQNVTLDKTYDATIARLEIGSTSPSATSTLTQNASFGLATNTVYIGSDGNGAFDQSAATPSVFGALSIGYNAGATGSYTLSGAGTSLILSNQGDENLGFSGAGTFTQSGGTHQITSNFAGTHGLFMGSQQGSSGVYNLSGTGGLYAPNIR